MCTVKTLNYSSKKCVYNIEPNGSNETKLHSEKQAKDYNQWSTCWPARVIHGIHIIARVSLPEG